MIGRASGEGPARPGAPRHGRRALRLDAALSVLLAALVALSLVLTGRLWLTNPYLTPPPAPPASYVASDADGHFTAADTLSPLRIALHYGSGDVRALNDPGDPVFKAVWSVLLETLRQIAGRPLGQAKASNLAALAAAAASSPSIGAQFGARLSWGDLQAVWAGRQTSGSGPAGPAVDRVLIVPRSSGTTIYLAGGAHVVRVALPAAAAISLADELRARPGGGVPLRPMTGDVGGVKVLPGVFVPVAAPPPAVVRVERLDAQALVDASFSDPSVVRRAAENDGSLFFTDGEDWLSLSPGAVVRWNASAGPRSAKSGLVAALSQAVSFVDGRGGWPAATTLMAVRSAPAPPPSSARGASTAAAAPAGYQLAFAVRYDGWPVFSKPAALVVGVGSGGVTSYLRRVPVPVGSSAIRGGVTPAQALERLAAHWPAGESQGARLVSDVYGCYVYLGGSRLIPAWAFELADGGRVLVDALSGRVFGPASLLP